MAAIDFDLVRHALTLAQENQMNEVELEIAGTKFVAVIDKKSAPKPAPAAPAAPAAPVAGGEAVAAPTNKLIKATSVGIFRTAKVPLISGATVEVGDVIGSIFALGITNDIVSSVKGTIADILVEDGDPVEYGQVVMEVLP